MRIMTILGSPRRQGNTAKVLGWMEERFQDDGYEVDSANTSDFCPIGYHPAEKQFLTVMEHGMVRISHLVRE